MVSDLIQYKSNMMNYKQLQKPKSYDIIMLMRPSASEAEINDVIQTVRLTLEPIEATIYHTEHSARDLKYKIKDFQSSTFVVIGCTGPSELPNAIHKKFKYNTQVLRFVTFKHDKLTVSRFTEAPLEKAGIHPLNPRLSECLTEQDRIIPFKLSKSVSQNTQNHRMLSKRIKTARTLGLYF